MTSKLKTLTLILAIAVITLPAFALGTVTGTSPTSNALDVSVRIPERVGIKLAGDNLLFDLGDASVTYPPASFPGYYFPTGGVTATPYVPLEVFCNNPAGWTLTVIAGGDFDASLPVTQLFYAPDGEAKTADGSAVGGNWTAFSTVSATVTSSATKTNGWENHDQDYQLQITGNEDVIDPASTVTITYTITSP